MTFRISVSLNSFFNDQRSLSYILIDKRFQTIEDLENHIKKVFKLKSDCNICLISNNHLLPSSEEINLIHEGDTLQVSPVNKDFCLRANEDDLQPPLKKRKTSKKNSNITCISIEDSSDEKDILKIEPEYVQHSTKKKRKKRSIQFVETFSSDTQKIETGENVANDVDSAAEQRNTTDNKNIQILNIQNVSNMNLDTINSTNLDTKIDEHELVFCNTDCTNEISTSKCYNQEGSRFSITNCTSKIDENGSASKQQEICNNSKYCSAESRTLKIHENDISSSKLDNLETSSKLSQNENTSQVTSITSGMIKNDTLDVNEKQSIVKNGCDTSNEFIEHLRSSYNGTRGKIPPFTVGDFLNYAHTIGHKQENTIENKNMKSPSTHVTRRRRRVRKRKSHSKDRNSSINSVSDIEFEFRQPLKVANPLFHIRFDTDDKNENEIMSNTTDSAVCTSTPNQTTTRIFIENDKNEIVANNNTFNCSKETNIAENETNNIRNKNQLSFHPQDVNDNYFKSIDLTNNLENVKNIIMSRDMPPKINDIIAFKLYELNEKYEPYISNWIVGKIINWYSTEKFVDVLILAGHIKKNVPNGKFELEDNDFVNEDDRINNKSNVVHLNFEKLIDLRLLTTKD